MLEWGEWFNDAGEGRAAAATWGDPPPAVGGLIPIDVTILIPPLLGRLGATADEGAPNDEFTNGDLRGGGEEFPSPS